MKRAFSGRVKIFVAISSSKWTNTISGYKMPLDRLSAVVSFGRNVFATFSTFFVHYMAPLIGRENCLHLGSGVSLVGTVFLSFFASHSDKQRSGQARCDD